MRCSRPTLRRRSKWLRQILYGFLSLNLFSFCLAGTCLVHPHEEQRLSRELGCLGTEQKGLLFPIPNPSEKNLHLLCGTLTGKVSHKKNECMVLIFSTRRLRPQLSQSNRRQTIKHQGDQAEVLDSRLGWLRVQLRLAGLQHLR